MYLNFDAEGTFTYDDTQPSDATSNRHDRNSQITGTLTGFNGDQFDKAAILAGVRTDFAAYRVKVVDSRPPPGTDYSMVVFTEDPNANPNAVANGATDCGDMNDKDVAFVFFNLTPISNIGRVNFVSTQLARFAGLDGLNGVDDNKVDVMYPYLNSSDAAFVDECLELGSSVACSFNHTIHCTGGGVQNFHVELESTWGF